MALAAFARSLNRRSAYPTHYILQQHYSPQGIGGLPIYRRPRSLISYHILVFFALSCASWNTAAASRMRQSEARQGRQRRADARGDGRKNEARTFSFRTVHSFSERRDAGVSASRAGPCGCLQGSEVLCLINHLREPCAECLSCVEGRREAGTGRSVEENRRKGGQDERTSVKTFDSSSAGSSFNLKVV